MPLNNCHLPNTWQNRQTLNRQQIILFILAGANPHPAHMNPENGFTFGPVVNAASTKIDIFTYILGELDQYLSNPGMHYRRSSNIRRTIVSNKIVSHSDVVGALPVGAAPRTSSFSTWYLVSMDRAKTTVRWGRKHLSVVIWCAFYWKFDGTSVIFCL